VSRAEDASWSSAAHCHFADDFARHGVVLFPDAVQERLDFDWKVENRNRVNVIDTAHGFSPLGFEVDYLGWTVSDSSSVDE